MPDSTHLANLQTTIKERFPPEDGRQFFIVARDGKRFRFFDIGKLAFNTIKKTKKGYRLFKEGGDDSLETFQDITNMARCRFLGYDEVFLIAYQHGEVKLVLDE